MDLAEPLLERVQPAAGVALQPALPSRLVEEDRRRLELVEDEHQHAQQQDEELHRDLEHGVEHQPEPALAQRRPREVALHLRLVGAEVRQRQEEAAQQAGPEGVAPVHVEREVDALSLWKPPATVRASVSVSAAGSFDAAGRRRPRPCRRRSRRSGISG